MGRCRGVSPRNVVTVPFVLITQVLVDELWCRVGDDLPDVRDATLRACERIARDFVAEHPEQLQTADLDTIDGLLPELLAFARLQGVTLRDEPWPLYWMPEGVRSERSEPPG